MRIVPCVYLLSNSYRGLLYTGMTTYLSQRIWQHKERLQPGFSAQHGLNRLVWYETHETIETAARREKSIKRWHREWKIRLVEKKNPEWRDLSEELLDF